MNYFFSAVLMLLPSLQLHSGPDKGCDCNCRHDGHIDFNKCLVWEILNGLSIVICRSVILCKILLNFIRPYTMSNCTVYIIKSRFDKQLELLINNNESLYILG